MIEHAIGKEMILWVMFTSGLNYFMYRDIREKQNKDKDKDKDK